METKANYTIVGIFTLIVIAAAFGFRRRPEPWRLPSGIDREHR